MHIVRALLQPSTPLAPLTANDRRRLLDEVDAARERLVPIEQEILDGLRARPLDTWCPGCDRLLRALAVKAKGELHVDIRK